MAIATKIKTNTPVKSSFLPEDFQNQIANNLTTVNNPEEKIETPATEESSKLDETSYSMELKQHVNFFNTYTQKVEELKENLKATWLTLGQTEATLNALNGKATEEAVEQVEETAEAGNSAATDEATDAEEKDTTDIAAPTEEELAKKDLELEENFLLAA